eukprot:scaffold3710_cov103-Cylindrotheca_fusiformis.AAC.4
MTATYCVGLTVLLTEDRFTHKYQSVSQVLHSARSIFCGSKMFQTDSNQNLLSICFDNLWKVVAAIDCQSLLGSQPIGPIVSCNCPAKNHCNCLLVNRHCHKSDGNLIGPLSFCKDYFMVAAFHIAHQSKLNILYCPPEQV